MSATQVAPPYPVFADLNGSPLDAGYVFLGMVNLNPETNPINVYWDEALTIPASQPIRTIGGYPSRNGTPSVIYTDGAYSITVKDKLSRIVFTSAIGYATSPSEIAASIPVVTVANNIGNINSLVGNMPDVLAVEPHLGSIDAVAGDLGGIWGLDGAYDFGSITDPPVGVISPPTGNIATVATNITNVNTVATNISSVNTVAANIAAILASVAGALQRALNLSDLTDVVAARLNLGLGSLATKSTVQTADIVDANVTTAKIADGNVTSAKILDANVTTSKIADSNVTTAKIADSSITTAKILDANVTPAKLSAGAPSWASNGSLTSTTSLSGNSQTFTNSAASSENALSFVSSSSTSGAAYKLANSGLNVQFTSRLSSSGGVDFYVGQTSGASSTTGTLAASIPSGGGLTIPAPVVFGYTAGSGGSVTQATSKSTSVTLNKPTGQITMNAAALAANTTVSFSFNNSTMSATDLLIFTVVSGVASGQSYNVWASNNGPGGCTINVRNITGGSLSEAVVIGYCVIKGATS